MRPTRSLLNCSIVAAGSLLWAHMATAECVPEDEATPSSDCVITSRSGQSGVWITRSRADDASREHEAYAVVQRMLKQYADVTALQATQIQAYKQADADMVASMQACTSAVEQAKNDAAAERAARDAWYRSPWLWAGVGTALGAFVTYKVTR